MFFWLKEVFCSEEISFYLLTFDENNYKKRFQFGFSKDVYCHCIIHADTQEEADVLAKQIFNDGEDNKDWYCEYGEIESPTVEEINES